MDGISDRKYHFWPPIPQIFTYFRTEEVPSCPKQEPLRGEELLKKAKPIEHTFSKHYLQVKKIFPWMAKSLDENDISKNLLNFLPETLAVYPENLMSKQLRTRLEEIFEMPITHLFFSPALSKEEILICLSLEELKLFEDDLLTFLQASDEYIKILESEIAFFEPIAWQEKNYRYAVKELNAKLSNFKASLALFTKLKEFLEKNKSL